jgi:hypothetical protein
MSGMINFNAQLAPMEHIEKVVRQEQEHGQVQQEALMRSAARRLSRDNEQVQETDASKKGRRVDKRGPEDEDARKKGGAFAQRDGGLDGQADDEVLFESAQTGRWSGNIINVKV